MEAFAKQLATAVAKYHTKLEKASHGEVRPQARGGTPSHDSQETILETDGLRRLGIISRVCLAPTAQIKKDLKTKIKDANQDVQKVGNPITHLLTVTKHDLKMYTELEQQVVWEDTAHVVIKHLLARCGIGSAMTDLVRKLDMWSSKKTEDVSDTNQEYTDMILDPNELWENKKKTATTGFTPKATEDWETSWWARHMAHNEGEASSDATRLQANQAHLINPNQPRRHEPCKVSGGIPASLVSKPWTKDSFHVAEYVECRRTGNSIPIFRSGFNADRRFNDRDFNTFTSEKIILEHMNMLPAAPGAPMGKEPYHKDIVPPVQREQRPQRNDRHGGRRWWWLPQPQTGR